MRLIEKARLAYPNCKEESANELRKHFLATVPSTIREKILDAERVIRADPKQTTKHITFTKMVEMARNIQKQFPPTKQIIWSAQQSRVGPAQDVANHPQHRSGQSAPTHRYLPPSNQSGKFQPSQRVTYYSSNYQSSSQPRQSRSPNPIFCNYCKRANHTLQHCWRAAKLCLICGQNHHLEKCHKFDPNYRRKFVQRLPTAKPTSN